MIKLPTQTTNPIPIHLFYPPVSREEIFSGHNEGLSFRLRRKLIEYDCY